jgi:hypothetical protein
MKYLLSMLSLFALFSGANASSYYVAASGDNSNSGLLGHPWQTQARVQQQGLQPGDSVAFNGPDTFTGCLTETGGSNWFGTAANPITLTSYGTGQATLTPNCAPSGSLGGVINFDKADGVQVINLHILGDTAGRVSRCISFTNSDMTKSHGPIWIQGNTFNTCHDGVDTNFGAYIFFDPSRSGYKTGFSHVTILNNDGFGLNGPMSADDNGMTGWGCGGSGAHCIQFDNVQGNHFYNIGGKASGIGGSEANGILFAGANSGLALFNKLDHNGANMAKCGDQYQIWTYGSDNVTVRHNEVDHNMAAGGCDGGAFDADGYSNNVWFEENYSHDNYGPAFTFYSAGTWGNPPNGYRWNISEHDGLGTNYAVEWQPGSGGTGIMRNNDINATIGAYNYAVFLAGGSKCPGADSVFANNNVVVGGVNSRMVILELGYGGAACSGPTFTHNNYYRPDGAPMWFRNGSLVSGPTAWQNIAPGGDRGALNANPGWSSFTADETCYIAYFGCPASYSTIASAITGAGANMTRPVNNLLTMRQHDFYYGSVGAPNSIGAYNASGRISAIQTEFQLSRGSAHPNICLQLKSVEPMAVCAK